MRRSLLFLVILILAIAASCVPSLHQLYTDSDRLFRPKLTGTWVSGDGKDTCIFQAAGDSSYDITYSQEGVSKLLEGHLVLLGDRLFMDTYPGDVDMGNDFYESHLIPGHMISRIWLEGDSLQASLMDDEWLNDLIEGGQIKVAHDYVGGSTILTASTEELRKFISNDANDEDAFSSPSVYYRR